MGTGLSVLINLELIHEAEFEKSCPIQQGAIPGIIVGVIWRDAEL
jgi:hypothetical protein